MRAAVISDIHGNLPALEAVLAATRHEVDAYVCLGDLVNYGPWSNECVDLVCSLPGLVVVRGNHEDLFLRPEEVAGELPIVQRFFDAAFAGFDRFGEIAALPDEATVGGFRCVHTVDGRRIYADTELDLATDTMIGHSHHAYEVRRSGHRLVNPGSVGQNRARVDLACYAVLDTVSGAVTLRHVPYDVDALLAEMRARRWPDDGVAYYLGKLPGGRT